MAKNSIITTRVIGSIYAVIQPFDNSMGYASDLFHVKEDAEAFLKVVHRGYIRQLDVKVIEK